MKVGIVSDTSFRRTAHPKRATHMVNADRATGASADISEVTTPNVYESRIVVIWLPTQLNIRIPLSLCYWMAGFGRSAIPTHLFEMSGYEQCCHLEPTLMTQTRASFCVPYVDGLQVVARA